MDYFDLLLAKKLNGGGGEQGDIATQPLTVSQNGIYRAPTGKAYTPVNVNVEAFEPSGTVTLNENGTFDVYNYSQATVSVPTVEPTGTLNISANGVFDVKNYASASVNVQGGSSDSKENEIIERTISGTYVNNVVTIVGDHAFENCKSLTEVSFENCLSIGINAFATATNIRNASFPKCIYIGIGAFNQNSRLTSIFAPEVSRIEQDAFFNCSRLTDINFPKCSYIGHNAFKNTLIPSAYFPLAETIDISAFFSCRSLSQAVFPICTNISNMAFNSCKALVDISAPNCIRIGQSAFQFCYELASASFPACETIGSYAFFNCSKLSQVFLLNSSIVQLETAVFNGTPIFNSSILGYFGSVYVPASLVDAYKSATNWSACSNRITAYGE